MVDVCLVSCVGQKRAKPAPAELLYVSPWFRKARAYAKRYARCWYILSAKYGLVGPSRLIEPYEETLNRMPRRERDAWAELVLSQITRAVGPTEALEFLAGARYRAGLVPALRALGYTVEVPMEGLRIGEQLSWLTQRTGGGDGG